MSAFVANLNKPYPALSEMGITRFHEISRYSLRPDGSNRDILRVHYKRAKGSFLAQSRKYQFGRSSKMVIADGGTARMEQTWEISPFLLKAVSELDSLVANGSKGNSVAAEQSPDHARKVEFSKVQNAALLADINSLEAWVKETVDAAQRSAVESRFAALKAQLAHV